MHRLNEAESRNWERDMPTGISGADADSLVKIAPNKQVRWTFRLLTNSIKRGKPTIIKNICHKNRLLFLYMWAIRNEINTKNIQQKMDAMIEGLQGITQSRDNTTQLQPRSTTHLIQRGRNKFKYWQMQNPQTKGRFSRQSIF